VQRVQCRLQRSGLVRNRQITYGIGKAGFSIQTHEIRIIDTVYFGDSANSRLLQFADLCCSVIAADLLVTHEYVKPDEKYVTLAPFYPLIQEGVVNDGVPPLYSRKRMW
jgi:hypothetical protein